MCDEKKSTLDYIQEMFKDKVDGDVIKLVLTECQFNVDKTVMQLLSLSESMSSKNKVGFSSSLHRLDDIDPVDTPLSDIQQYLSPVTTKDCAGDQLDFSILPPKAQFSDACKTKPVSPDNNPGTGRPLFPNYANAGNENFFASNTFLPTEPKVQSGTKLGDEFNENEMYVSDDDIDDHIDSIDDNDTIDRIDKVDPNAANHSNVKDENIAKKVKQSVSNTNKNINTEHRSFQNDRAFRANKPQQKQVNLHNGSGMTSRQPIRPQFNMPQKQSSYFANQAQYFPTFASSAFPRPFVRLRGNMPPVQYQGPPPQAMFRPPAFNHFPPGRSRICGNIGPSYPPPTTSMTNGSKGPITSMQGNKGYNYPIPITSTQGSRGSNHPMPITFIRGNRGPSYSLPITSTEGNKEPNHHTPITFKHGNRGPNYPISIPSTHGNTGPNHPMPITSTQGNIGPRYPKPIISTQGNKGPNYPMPITSTQGNIGPRYPIPITSTQGNIGPRHPIPITSTLGNKRPNYPIPITSTQGSKVPNYPIPITSTEANKGPRHPMQITSTHGNKGPNYPMPITYTHGNKGPSYPMPITSKQGNIGPNQPMPITSTHGNKGHINHPMPITHGNTGPNNPTPTITSMTCNNIGPNLPIQLNYTHGKNEPNHPMSVTSTHGSKEPTNPMPITSKNGNKPLKHSTSPTTTMPHGNKRSNHAQKGYGHSQSRMQAKFPPQEKKLIILRGLPGSGKSTLARHLDGMIISTDDYFTTTENRYSFNPIELTEAHEWNQNRAKTFMKAGLTPLVIDNTNTQSWEMRPYVLIGLKCGYKVDIREPDTWWKWNIKELERRNTHGVLAKTLEKMLERYEKNVTVDSIAKTAGQPVVTSSKPDNGKLNQNAVKHENKQCTSSGSKPLKESEKLPKANGKSEPKRPATTKRTISLSANFSAPPNRSKRSFGDRDSTKQVDKQNATRFNTDKTVSDLIGNAADASGINESNLDEVVTKKDKQSISITPSIDGTTNDRESTGEGCVILEDMTKTSSTALKSNSAWCAVEASSNGSNLDLCERLEIDNCASTNAQPGDTQNDELNLQDVSNGNDDLKNEPIIVDMHPKSDASSNDDLPLASKEVLSGILNRVEENEETRGELGISSPLTLSDSKHLFSGKGTSVEPEMQASKGDEIVDVRSDRFQGISDEELTEGSTRKNLDTSLNYSGSGVPFASTDSSLVPVCNHDPDISIATNARSSPNNQEPITKCGTLALSPMTDSHDSTSAEEIGTGLQTDVPNTDNEDIKICFDQDLETNSTSSYTDLHPLKVDSSNITASLEEDSIAGVLDRMTDTNNYIADVKDDKCDSIVAVEDEKCYSNSIERDLNCKNTEQNSSTEVFDLKANRLDANIGIQAHTFQSDTECVENVITSTHDSRTNVQQTKPDVQDLVVNPNFDVRSDTKLDVPNADAVYVCKSDGKDSCNIDHQGVDTSSIAEDNVEKDPSITLQGPPGEKDSSPAVDFCTTIQSSNDDIEQLDYKTPDTIDSVSDDMDGIDIQFPNIEMGNPLVDRTEANVKDEKLYLESLDSSVQSSESDMPSSSAVDQDDSLDPIQFLVDCFPHTEINLLKSFLNSCDGDLLKTVDSILEHKENVYHSAENLDNSPRSISSTERNVHDFAASPNVNGEVDVASRNLFTPEENRNSYGTIKVESPISSSSTPKKFQDISVHTLQLTLDAALAYQLLEMFGAFSGVSAKDPLSESSRSIKIDKDLAKIIYTKWRKTVQGTNKAKKIEESKKFSPVSGLFADGSTRRKFKTPPRQFYLPDPGHTKPAKSVAPQPVTLDLSPYENTLEKLKLFHEPVSLKEIMDEQLAIHVSQSDQEVEKRFLEEQLDLSTKLKRSRLHGMFPGVDAVALNEIFQANNYDLDTTILQVQSSCGMPVTGNPTAVSPDQSLNNYQSPSNRQWSEFPSESLAEFPTEVDGNFQSLNDPSYQDYRAEAQTHFELRTECIKKAALAYSKKQGELAKIYADQARHHGEKIKEANRRAAEKILESRNHDLVHSNTLDLHELHVNEAIQVLDNVLEERRKERRGPNRRSPSYIEVITGRGNRSRDGRPRIKPAVVEYLKRNGYRFEELNSGLYKVFLN